MQEGDGISPTAIREIMLLRELRNPHIVRLDSVHICREARLCWSLTDHFAAFLCLRVAFSCPEDTLVSMLHIVQCMCPFMLQACDDLQGMEHAGCGTWWTRILHAPRRTPACRWHSSMRSTTCTRCPATTAWDMACCTLTLILHAPPQDPSLSLASEYAEHDLYEMARHHCKGP